MNKVLTQSVLKCCIPVNIAIIMIVLVEVLFIITIYSRVKPLPMGTLGSEEIGHCREVAAIERQECNIHVTLVCFGGATLIFLKNATCTINAIKIYKCTLYLKLKPSRNRDQGCLVQIKFHDLLQ